MMVQRTDPVIVLAYANSASNPLSELENEYKQLNTVLKPAQDRFICEVIPLPFASLEDLLNILQDAKYRNRIAIIHIAGHGSKDALVFQGTDEGTQAAYRSGFVDILTEVQSLQLVFLNACSTMKIAEDLCNKKIPIVIATLQSISDKAAVQLAERFYNGLSQGQSIGTAFAMARAEVESTTNGDYRNLYIMPETSENRVPWEIYTRPGSDEVSEWNLPTAAGNPLYSLPPVPEGDLPDKPFRYLDWFSRKDAEVFFGRGKEILSLYNQLTAEDRAPILLFYGQSGIGKSSLLEAGLLPRLNNLQGQYQVEVWRRDQNVGSLETLRKALQASSDKPMDTLGDLWQKREKTGQRLVVILDQLEEIFTRPVAETVHASPSEELNQLIIALKAIFDDRANRPKGKLVLSFRQEWLSRIRESMAPTKLYYDEMPLGRLSKEGVMEAISGPASNERLQVHYHLLIEGVNDSNPEAQNLPQIIADDLYKDDEANIAPMLQILLAKLWDEAKTRNNNKPSFDRPLYETLSRQGLLVEDFLQQALDDLQKTWKPEVYQTGLPLDVLEYHTTVLGTSDQHDEDEIRRYYAHEPDLAVELVRQFKERRILTDISKNQSTADVSISRLAHDALAPVVRRDFEHSRWPGQRARRILERRVSSSDDDSDTPAQLVDNDAKTAPSDELAPFDNYDLKIVESGRSGMRDLSKKEKALVEKSEKEQQRQQKQRQRNRVLLATLAGIIILVSVFLIEAIARSNVQANVNDSLRNVQNAVTFEDQRDHQRALAFALEGAKQANAPAIAVDTLRRLAYAPSATKIETSPAQLGYECTDLTSYEVGLAQSTRQFVFSLPLKSMTFPGLTVTPIDEDHTLEITLRDGSNISISPGKQILNYVFSPNLSLVAVYAPDTNLADTDQQLLIYSTKDGAEIGEMPYLDYQPGVLIAFRPDGNRIASFNRTTHEIVMRETTSDAFRGKGRNSPIIRIPYLEQGNISKIQILTNNDLLLTTENGCEHWVYPFYGGIKTLYADKGVDSRLPSQFGPDQQTVADIGYDGGCIRSIESITAVPDCHPELAGLASAYSPDGESLLVEQQDTTLSFALKFIRLRAGKFDSVIDTYQSSPSASFYRYVAVSHDGAYGASVPCFINCSVNRTDAISIWKLNDQSSKLIPAMTLIVPYAESDMPGASILSINFSPTENKLLATTDTGRVVLWDLNNSNPPISAQVIDMICDSSADTYNSVAKFMPDGKQVVIGVPSRSECTDQQSGNVVVNRLPMGLELWEPKDNTLVRVKSFYDLTSTSDNSNVTSLAVSLDGKQILSANDNGQITLWEVETGTAISTFHSPNPDVGSLTFTRDGKSAMYIDVYGGYTLPLSETADDIITWAEQNRVAQFTRGDCDHYKFTNYCPPEHPVS
ncbi:MAG: CHAT domain-containing protein [Chloroflexota bacterium]